MIEYDIYLEKNVAHIMIIKLLNKLNQVTHLLRAGESTYDPKIRETLQLQMYINVLITTILLITMGALRSSIKRVLGRFFNPGLLASATAIPAILVELVIAIHNYIAILNFVSNNQDSEIKTGEELSFYYAVTIIIIFLYALSYFLLRETFEGIARRFYTGWISKGLPRTIFLSSYKWLLFPIGSSLILINSLLLYSPKVGIFAVLTGISIALPLDLLVVSAMFLLFEVSSYLKKKLDAKTEVSYKVIGKIPSSQFKEDEKSNQEDDNTRSKQD